MCGFFVTAGVEGVEGVLVVVLEWHAGVGDHRIASLYVYIYTYNLNSHPGGQASYSYKRRNSHTSTAEFHIAHITKVQQIFQVGELISSHKLIYVLTMAIISLSM